MDTRVVGSRALLLAAVLAAAATTACGGGGPSAATRVADAAGKTTAAKTARFAVNASASASGQTISSVGQGVVDFGRHAVDVKFGRPANEAQAQRDQQTTIVGNDTWASTPQAVKNRLSS